MDKDDLVWQKIDEATDEWDISIVTSETYKRCRQSHPKVQGWPRRPDAYGGTRRV